MMNNINSSIINLICFFYIFTCFNITLYDYLLFKIINIEMFKEMMDKEEDLTNMERK